MNTLKERFIVDEKGNRVQVILDIADYYQLLEAWEELESIRAYDVAKASEDEAIPFEQAVHINNPRVRDASINKCCT